MVPSLDYYELMKQFPRAVAVLVLSASLPWALAQTPAVPNTAPPTTPGVEPAPAQSRLTARLMYELLLGEMLFNDGDPQMGTAYMLDAARRTGDGALFKRAAEMAVQSRSGQAALEATRTWRQSQPGSVEASRYELQVLIALGKVADTEAPLRGLMSSLPAAEKESIVLALPALYQRVADKAAAAQAVERALTDALKDPTLAPAAWTTVGRLRAQAGDQAGAFAAATLGRAANERSEWPALLSLQLLATGETRAEPLVRDYLATPDAKPEVQIGYARALNEAGRIPEALAQLENLTIRLPGYPEGWLVHGALLADERQDAEAETVLSRYLALANDAADPETGADRAAGRDRARLMLARLAERRGDYAAADQLLAQVRSPDEALAVQTRRANILARQGRLEEAREAIRAVPERRSGDARLKVLAEAQLLRDHQQAPAAYALLSAELAKDPDDEALLYDTAMAAERVDRMDDMERLMRRLIALKPDAHSAYNALGYSLADRGLRLTEAKALIEKAVQMAPDDAYIQDSLGWVEFRLGRPQQARQILEAAYRKRPDAEIAAHLGEVLWVLGEQDAARRVWREGQRLDASNETLTKTLKRFQVSP